MGNKKKLMFIIPVAVLLLLILFTSAVSAAPLALPKIGLDVGASENPQDVALSLQIMALLTILSLAPAILIMMTCFTRIIVVFSFLRNALATQQMPPNQILIGLSLFLTFFVMAPVWNDINQNALQPYLDGTLTQEIAFTRGMEPIRDFMVRQTREKDLALFVNLARLPQPEDIKEVPTYVIIPAYAISELKTAFQIGFILYIPFIVIDMVIASTLMSMGMMMLPPMMISLPFKLLLFILVDGWNLLVQTLITSFR